MSYEHPLAYLLGLEGIVLRRAFTGEYDRDFVDARVDEIRRLLDDESLAACGTGRYAEYLAGLGHRVVGVDSSPDMLARARARVPGADLRRGDLHRLPLADSEVDVVVCALALTHVPDLGPVVAEFARVLRPGGHLVLSDAHHERVALGSVRGTRAPATRQHPDAGRGADGQCRQPGRGRLALPARRVTPGRGQGTPRVAGCPDTFERTGSGVTTSRSASCRSVPCCPRSRP